MRKVIIQSANINGYQPEGYKDYVIAHKEPIMLGLNESILETENKVQLKGETSTIEETVQSIFYPKYKLQFIANTRYLIELLKHQSKVTIKQQGEADVDAKVLDISREALSKDAYKIEITYYDKAEQGIAENLKSEQLKTLETNTQTWKFNYSETGYILTRINPDSISGEPEQVDYVNNNVRTLNKTIIRESKQFTFYISEEENIDLQKSVYTYKCSIDDLGVQIEPLKPSITKLNGHDLYKVVIDFIYNMEVKY